MGGSRSATRLLPVALRAAWGAPACSCSRGGPWAGALLRQAAAAAAGGAQAQAVVPRANASALQHARGFLGGLAPAESPSKVYTERRLMGWSPEQMYAVVSRVEDYHHFVPWCVGSSVVSGSPGGGYLEAELEVGFQVFTERYTSKVTLTAPQRVHSSVSDSRLFDHLESTWTLRPGPTPGTTWLSFKVDFAFSSALYRHVADVFFDQVVKRMMAAFEGRCAALYGPSALARPCGGSGGGARVVPRAGEARGALEGGGGGGGGEPQYRPHLMPAAKVLGLHSAQRQHQQQPGAPPRGGEGAQQLQQQQHWQQRALEDAPKPPGSGGG